MEYHPAALVSTSDPGAKIQYRYDTRTIITMSPVIANLTVSWHMRHPTFCNVQLELNHRGHNQQCLDAEEECLVCNKLIYVKGDVYEILLA